LKIVLENKNIKEPEPAEEHTEFVSNSRVIVQRHNNVQDNAFGFGVEDQEPAHNIKIDGVSFGVFLKKEEED